MGGAKSERILGLAEVALDAQSIREEVVPDGRTGLENRLRGLRLQPVRRCTTNLRSRREARGLHLVGMSCGGDLRRVARISRSQEDLHLDV